MTVNVSADRFQDTALTLSSDVALALKQTMLPPELLVLEINERTVIDNPESVTRELRKLRDLEVGVALDDFGTDHTSLTHLQQLPIGILKIDCGLVRGIGDDDTNDKRVLSAMATLAHILGMTVIAEGAERPEQVAVLQQTGCNAAQGFLFSPPAEPDAADSWLYATKPGRRVLN